MKEESQLDDMRAALRGDRERAEQTRQRSLENVRSLLEASHAEPPPQPERPVSGLRRWFRRP